LANVIADELLTLKLKNISNTYFFSS
jgi:hypothetical protein